MVLAVVSYMQISLDLIGCLFNALLNKTICFKRAGLMHTHSYLRMQK